MKFLIWFSLVLCVQAFQEDWKYNDGKHMSVVRVSTPETYDKYPGPSIADYSTIRDGYFDTLPKEPVYSPIVYDQYRPRVFGGKLGRKGRDAGGHGGHRRRLILKRVSTPESYDEYSGPSVADYSTIRDGYFDTLPKEPVYSPIVYDNSRPLYKGHYRPRHIVGNLGRKGRDGLRHGGRGGHLVLKRVSTPETYDEYSGPRIADYSTIRDGYFDTLPKEPVYSPIAYNQYRPRHYDGHYRPRLIGGKFGRKGRAAGSRGGHGGRLILKRVSTPETYDEYSGPSVTDYSTIRDGYFDTLPKESVYSPIVHDQYRLRRYDGHYRPRSIGGKLGRKGRAAGGLGHGGRLFLKRVSTPETYDDYPGPSIADYSTIRDGYFDTLPKEPVYSPIIRGKIASRPRKIHRVFY